MSDASGFTWDDVAAKFGISARQCRRIVADYRESQPILQTPDPVHVVERAYARYDVLIDDLAEIAATSMNESVQIGAIKQTMAATKAQINLLQPLVLALPRGTDERDEAGLARRVV